MIRPSSIFPSTLIAACAASLLIPFEANGKPVSSSLRINDVPSDTQMGEGSGKYTPPVPARPELPTIWLIDV